MFEKQLKRMDAVDLGLIKLATAAVILFIITVWPAALSLVLSIHWGWFLGAAVVFAARPCYRIWLKK